MEIKNLFEHKRMFAEECTYKTKRKKDRSEFKKKLKCPKYDYSLEGEKNVIVRKVREEISEVESSHKVTLN